MAAEITLFARIGKGGGHVEQAAADPIKSYSATFTTPQDQGGLLRVYANGAAVALSIDGITFTVPAGGVEYFGVAAAKTVTVA